MPVLCGYGISAGPGFEAISVNERLSLGSSLPPAQFQFQIGHYLGNDWPKMGLGSNRGFNAQSGFTSLLFQDFAASDALPQNTFAAARANLAVEFRKRASIFRSREPNTRAASRGLDTPPT